MSSSPGRPASRRVRSRARRPRPALAARRHGAGGRRAVAHGAAAVLAAMLIVVGVAACGSGSGGGSAGAGGGDGGAAGGGEATTLRFAYFSGENDPHGRLWAWWMDEVERRTDGAVSFEPFWDATLLDATEMVDGLRDGRVDLATVAPTYYPGTFPVTNVAELPFVTENVPAASQAFAELGRTSEPLRAEWSRQGLHPVAFNAGPGSAIGSRDPIDSVDDLDGMRLRALDRGSKLLARAGANLVNIGLPELYSSLQRDLVNGYYGVPFAFAGPTRLIEVTEHLTDPGIGLAAMSALAMSESGWERLPADVRDAMEEVSAEVPAQQARFLAAAEDETCAAAREEGVEISVLPPAEVERLRAGADEIRDAWIAEADDAGYPGERFHREYTTAVAEAADDFPDYETGLKRCLAGAAG